MKRAGRSAMGLTGDRHPSGTAAGGQAGYATASKMKLDTSIWGAASNHS